MERGAGARQPHPRRQAGGAQGRHAPHARAARRAISRVASARARPRRRPSRAPGSTSTAPVAARCSPIDAAAVEALIAKRNEARKQKSFAEADAIRAELAKLSVEIMDTPARHPLARRLTPALTVAGVTSSPALRRSMCAMSSCFSMTGSVFMRERLAAPDPCPFFDCVLEQLDRVVVVVGHRLHVLPCRSRRRSASPACRRPSGACHRSPSAASGSSCSAICFSSTPALV